MTAAYCPACLDVCNIQPSRLDRGDFLHIPAGTSLHVSCGRVLEALRIAPPLYSFGDDDLEPLPVGWLGMVS